MGLAERAIVESVLGEMLKNIEVQKKYRYEKFVYMRLALRVLDTDAEHTLANLDDALRLTASAYDANPPSQNHSSLIMKEILEVYFKTHERKAAVMALDHRDIEVLTRFIDNELPPLR